MIVGAYFGWFSRRFDIDPAVHLLRVVCVSFGLCPPRRAARLPKNGNDEFPPKREKKKDMVVHF